METLTSKHWTAESIEDFTFRIASDFLAQVETKIEAGEITRAELAQRLDRTPGRVSQLFNNPGNLTVTSAVRLVRAAGMKVALVAYDDNDPQNNNGPVNSEIFSRCWQHMGAPNTLFELAASTASAGNCSNAYTVNGCNPAVMSTLNANSLVTTVLGNHDVNCDYYFIHSQGTSGGICDMGTTSSSIGMTGTTGVTAATSAIKITQEPIPLYAN